jgi:RNA:NAD 2'-phosphotransferase (TPT1/KptA family)
MIRLINLLKEASNNIPPILYHATYRPLLKKIKEDGLDTKKSKKAWEDSKPGLVYLATNLDVAASYAESSEMVPDSYLDNIIILHIDTSQLDLTKLSIDQNVQDNKGDTLEYDGIIPFSAISKITKYE